MNATSLLYDMLKIPHFLSHQFKKNKEAQEKLFNYVCRFGSQEEWRGGRLSVSSYIDVNYIKDQDLLINPKPLVCIGVYTNKYTVVSKDFKKTTQINLKLIDIYISS